MKKAEASVSETSALSPQLRGLARRPITAATATMRLPTFHRRIGRTLGRRHAITALALANRVNGLLQRYLERFLPGCVVIKILHLAAVELLGQHSIDIANFFLFFMRHNCKRITGRFRARSAADTVDVVIRR